MAEGATLKTPVQQRHEHDLAYYPSKGPNFTSGKGTTCFHWPHTHKQNNGEKKKKKMLADEYGTASNIKSRVNRLSVLAAITSTQQRLKLYNKGITPRFFFFPHTLVTLAAPGCIVPDNGLIVYCGTIVTDEGKEKKVNIDFEPFKPINTSLYLCDNKFHTEALQELMESDSKFGFIVMDGNGSLFGIPFALLQHWIHSFF